MYSSINFKTKKAFKDAVAEGIMICYEARWAKAYLECLRERRQVEVTWPVKTAEHELKLYQAQPTGLWSAFVNADKGVVK